MPETAAPFRGEITEDFGRTPPHDLLAEQCTVGGMMMSKDAIADVLEIIGPAEHYKPAHQMIHEVILDLYGRGEPADAVMVANELTRRGVITKMGGAPYLHTCMAAVSSPLSAGWHARVVREKYLLRKLTEVGTRITDMGYRGTDDADDLVDRAEAEVYGITDRRTGSDFASMAEIFPVALEEIEQTGRNPRSLTGVPTGFADLDALTHGLHNGQMIVIAARPALGKALALDTLLPTPDGWTTMAAVKVGDQLIGADGEPVKVTGATEAMAGRPCYEVVFDDRTVIVADENHGWLTSTHASRKSAAEAAGAWSRIQYQRVFPSVKTTRCISETVQSTSDGRLNHAVENSKSLQLPAIDLPIPPYVLGVWLGDGTTEAAHFTSADPEVADLVEGEGICAPPLNAKFRYGLRFASAKLTAAVRNCIECGEPFTPATSEVMTCGRVCGCRSAKHGARRVQPTCPQCGQSFTGLTSGRGVCAECIRRHGSVQAELRELGVLGNKHIPQRYLRASEAQRRALLAGLMDTDGTVMKTGSVQLSLTHRRLTEDSRELLMSLGYRCGWSEKRVRGRTPETSIAYTLTFTTHDEVFRLTRKRVAHHERRTVKPNPKNKRRFITDVRPIPSVPVRCVEVDSDDHLYLASKSMIPTHNSTLALDFARSAALRNGLTTVIFSLEMSRLEITQRMVSAEARVSLHSIRTGQMTPDDWGRVAKYQGDIVDAPLFIDDSPLTNMMQIRSKCRRLKQRHDLRLVIIDYLQLMSSPKRVENRQQEVSDMSRELKILAKDLDVPVIAVAQLNRGPELRTNKRPLLADLRESGAIEQDADVVLLLHREDAYERETPRAGEADLIVAKHRNGPCATVTVAAQLHYSRFKDMARI